MRRFACLTIPGLCLLLAGPAWAAPPANGYIGVFGDDLGTECCITMNTAGNGRFHIFAVTGGATAAGVTGAEFRVSIEPSEPQATFQWSPAAGSVANGHPIDNGSGGGVDLSFQTCQTQTGLAGDKILLGTVHVLKLTGERQVVVRTHSAPANPAFACPTLTLCDAPASTRVCLTLQIGDPALGGEEPSTFTSAVNDPACTGASCGFVAIEPATWSLIKSFYN
jgi:hypothetical protein